MNLWTTILNLSIFEQCIAAVFLLSAIIQLLYYFLVFSKLAFLKEDTEQGMEYQPVSVIIAAHNEDYNLMPKTPIIFPCLSLSGSFLNWQILPLIKANSYSGLSPFNVL